MKAAVLEELGAPLQILDVPIPEIGDDEVLVRTMCCGICGTDLHMVEGFGYVPKLPHIPGHEPSGVVERVGRSVTTFKPGDRVVPHLFLTCGRCRYCLEGRDSMCADLKGIIGVLVDGALAEVSKRPRRTSSFSPRT